MTRRVSGDVRPRLAEHALARRHTARGETFVAIHDERDGSVLKVPLDAWERAARADGTRALAELDEGARAMVEELLRHGLIALDEEGARVSEGAGESAGAGAGATPASRPLEALPTYRFACDGSGTCCAHYASVEFLAEDVVRARTDAPAVEGGFLPLRGSRPGGPFAVALVDGRCAYLASDGRCAIHAAGGADAKPLSCRAYPRTFVDDGVSVRVSVGIECACALREPREDEATEALATGATWGDVTPGTKVRTLPEVVLITPVAGARREGVAQWSRSVLDAGLEGDAAAIFWQLAATLERGSGEVCIDAAPPPASEVREWVARVASRARGAADAADAWRSDNDVSRVARHAVARAGEAWLARGAGEWLPSRAPREERLYARATIFGHHLVGNSPLVVALRERAARLQVARAMEDPSAIATVEHVLRGQR
jgi:lysine-N-methylase